MNIETRENKRKQEVTLSISGVFNKENVSVCERTIEEYIDSVEWEKVIIDFGKTEDIDIEAIKLLWKMKDTANSMQKSFEFENMNGKVAVMFKVLGFSARRNITVDENIVNKIIMFGDYEEPLYENKEISREICLTDKKIQLEVVSDLVNEMNMKFGFDMMEWCVIPEISKDKLVFLIETQNVHDVESAEEYLSRLIMDKCGVVSSMYVLENGTFNGYYEKKRELGISSKVISFPKIIMNPYTKQYFLGKIDERY